LELPPLPWGELLKLSPEELRQQLSAPEAAARESPPLRISTPAATREEVASFRACRNRAAQAGKLAGPFPSRGLRCPKSDEKPPSRPGRRTRIRRRVAGADRGRPGRGAGGEG